MTNTDFTDISQFKDVESLNHYQILQDKGLSASDALRIIQIHSRDNGRTPMQWMLPNMQASHQKTARSRGSR